jgi:hypothetical protein
MTIHGRTAFLGAACAAALVVLCSCASGPVNIPAGLSAAEIFQRAQDASDRGDYPLGIRYYSMIPMSYPDDIAHNIWSSYEIAFLYHKMRRNALALSFVNELLARYDKEGDSLPPAPRVLAVKLKVRLEEALKTKQ